MRDFGRRTTGARRWPWAARALLAAVLGACLLGSLPTVSAAAPPCWQRVIADWSRDGRVDRVYPLVCYRQAVSHLPEDLRTYSSAPDDIARALQERRSSPTTDRLAAAPARPSVVTPSAGGRSLAVVVVPGVGGAFAAAAIGIWLLRARRPGA